MGASACREPSGALSCLGCLRKITSATLSFRLSGDSFGIQLLNDVAFRVGWEDLLDSHRCDVGLEGTASYALSSGAHVLGLRR